jgi:glycosyltransferase involved in cell wall biosynthesis
MAMKRFTKNDFMKKILFLINSLNFGGAETVFCDLAAGIDKNKFEAIAVTIMPPGEFSAKLAAAGCKVYNLGVKGKLDFLKARKIFGIIKEEKPDLISAHLFHSIVLARFIKIFFPRIIIISTLHNEYQGGRLREKILSLTDGLSEATTTISKKITDLMIKRKVMPESKARTIYNGLNFERFYPGRAAKDFYGENGFGENDRIIISWGRLVRAKGFDILIKAFEKISKPAENLRLLIIGEGPERKNLEKLIKESGLERKIFLAGYKENSEIPAYARQAELFVSSSRWEGMPTVIIEAMYLKLPVLATAVGGSSELIEDGRTGYSVEKPDENLLAEKIEEILSLSEAEKEAMAEIAFARVRKDFSVEKMAKNYEALFSEFLDRKKKIIWVTNSPNDIYFNFFEALGGKYQNLDLTIVLGVKKELRNFKNFKLRSLDRFGREILKIVFLPRLIRGIFKKSPVSVPNLSFLRGLGGFLKRERPDLILTNLYFNPSSWQAAFYAKRAGIPFILINEKKKSGFSAADRFLTSLSFLFLKSFLNQAAFIFCWTKDDYDFSLSDFPVKNKGKVKFFPPGINISNFYPPAAKIAEGKLKLLIVARPEPFKRYGDLFGAIKYLKENSDFNFELSVRADGAEESLRKEVKNLGISDKVVFIGNYPNEKMRELYWQNDVFILSSFNEPIGIVVPEAMACGLPAIVSDTTGAKIFVKDGVNGYIFKTFDFKDLAEKILLFKDRKKTEEFGASAARLIREKFSTVAMAEKFKELTSEIIKYE